MIVRRLLTALLALIVLAAGLYLYARAEARRDPVVRNAKIGLPGWPEGQGPVRAVLLSDIHLGGGPMDAARLARIVDQVAALRPDLVLIAGDFISGHERSAAVGAAGLSVLSRLHPRLGVIAVPGNHDHWTDAAAVRARLEGAGVTVLTNQAVARGPVMIGGVDDDFTGHASVPTTVAAMSRLPGAKLMLSHSPDVAPQLPAGLPLLLAGHTHCGQVYVPLLFNRVPSKYGDRYRCGLVRESGRLTVVTAGLGTSIVPLRLGAPPDL